MQGPTRRRNGGKPEHLNTLFSQFLITPGYLLLYRRNGSMWPVFAIHVIADAVLVLGAMYFIWPALCTL